MALPPYRVDYSPIIERPRLEWSTPGSLTPRRRPSLAMDIQVAP